MHQTSSDKDKITMNSDVKTLENDNLRTRVSESDKNEIKKVIRLSKKIKTKKKSSIKKMMGKNQRTSEFLM